MRPSLLLLIKLAAGLPLVSNELKIQPYLVTLESLSLKTSVSTQNSTPQQFLILNGSQFSNFNLEGIDYPIVVVGEEVDFYSRPIKNSANHTSVAAHKDQRYQITGSTSMPFLLQPKIPVSACTDSTHGSGGSVGKTVSFTLNSGISDSLALAEAVTGFVSVSTSYGISKSLELDFGVTCSADAGESVQIFLAPWMIEATTAYRTVEMSLQLGMRASDSWSEWFSSEWGVNVPPETYCSTSKEACAIPGLDDHAQVTLDRSFSLS